MIDGIVILEEIKVTKMYDFFFKVKKYEVWSMKTLQYQN